MQIESGAARGTIREALFQLEAEGLIYRRERSGWYVSPPPVTYDPTRWAGFMTFVSEQGRIPSTQVLATESIPAPPLLADIFRVAPGSRLFLISRRRLIDGRAVLIERITVNPQLAPGLYDHPLEASLTSILTNHYGLTVARNRVDMRPCALVKEVADEIGVKAGTPGLLVVRTSLDKEGRVINYDHEYWRHDSIRVHVDVSVKNDTPP